MLTLLTALTIFSPIANAQFSTGACALGSNVAAMNQGLLRNVVDIGGSHGECLSSWYDRKAQEMKEHPENIEKIKMQAQAADAATRSVRTIHCPDGSGKATFLNSKTFITSAHVLFRTTKDEAGNNQYFRSDVTRCNVEYLNEKKELVVIPLKSSAPSYVGDPYIPGDDLAAFSIDGNLPPTHFAPIANDTEVKENTPLLFILGQTAERTCFGIAECRGGTAPKSENELARTDCPAEGGSSGGPLYKYVLNKKTRQFEAQIAAIDKGSRLDKPAGSDFDPDSMYSGVVVITPRLRGEINKVLNPAPKEADLPAKGRKASNQRRAEDLPL